MARSAINYIYDDDMKFLAPGSAAVITTTSWAIPLDKLTAARGDQKNKLGAQQYAAVIAISASDAGNADETYVFTVEVGDTGAAATIVGTMTVTRGSTGQYVMLLDAETVEKMDADHAEIQLTLTVGGTTPSMTFGAWLTYA